jgi:hypothetical protein
LWHRADDFGTAARLSVVGGPADPLTAAIPLPQSEEYGRFTGLGVFRVQF